MERALTEGEALAVLGLRPGATAAEVDAAHRRLASRAHPDRWLAAPAEDRAAARDRFEEVNAAHRALRGSGSSAPPPAPRRRPQEPAGAAAPAPPPPTRPAAPPPVVADPPGDEDQPPLLSRGVVVTLAIVGVVVVLAVGVGLLSPSPDGSRQRRVLGPLAHRFWEAERSGDFATVWDLSDLEVQRLLGRDEFVARLALCPPSPPPRDVARIAKIGGRQWEVEWVDPAGQPGLTYFRQVADYRFAATLTDPDLRAFLDAPAEAAREQRWCGR